MKAIDAGKRALMSLRAAQNGLNSAKNWGIWDMLGGGFVSSEAIRRVEDILRQLQQY